MDKPSHWVTFLNYIFNPMAGFVHILPQIGYKTTQHQTIYPNMHSSSTQMLGCFNPNLGQIWTNVGLKCTVESDSWSWVKIWNDIFNPTFGFGFTQNWVQTTQHCLECGIQPCHAPIKQFPAQSFKCTVTGMSCMFT